MRKEKLYTGCLLLMALITGSCSEAVSYTHLTLPTTSRV